MIVDPVTYPFKNPKGFIVLEGVNGAGKSTLQGRLEAHLEAKSLKVVTTFEPGATPQGKALRRLLLEGRGAPLRALSELFLFAADRHEHVEQLIRPALAERKIVLCDRYVYSTIAFQGFGRGLDRPVVETINQLAVGGLVPDVVLLLDVDPREGLARAQQRSEKAPKKNSSDSFEQEDLSFHDALRSGFLEIAKSCPEPFIVLDASSGPDEVYSVAAQVLDRLLEGWEPRRHRIRPKGAASDAG